MPSSSKVATCLLAATCFVASTSGAQAPTATRLLKEPWTARLVDSGNVPGWLPPIASAIIPGSGQLLRSEDRGAIYFIAEAFLVQRFISLWIGARNAEGQYRDLAFSIARAQFNPAARDTVFEYFEQMGRFAESGPFDMDPGTRLVPPVDEETYNGAIWALARRTYFSGSTIPPDTSVTYQSALAFYRRRAIGPNYQWSWQNSTVEQDLFRQTIREGDETYRKAVRQLGLLMANHFLSAVDAFVSRRLSPAGRRVGVSPQLWLPPGQTEPSVLFRVGMTF